MKNERSDIIIEDENKYYLPICREYGCNGNLNISICEKDFIVDCICEKNRNQKF